MKKLTPTQQIVMDFVEKGYELHQVRGTAIDAVVPGSRKPPEFVCRRPTVDILTDMGLLMRLRGGLWVAAKRKE